MNSPKSTKRPRPVAAAKPGKERVDREPVALHEQRGRPQKRTRRMATVIDDDWTRGDRKRRRRNATIWLPEAKERTQAMESEAATESKYEPTYLERTILAKQAERLKDQVRVPRLKYVGDRGGERLVFDHPDQHIASALLKEAFGTADDQFATGLLQYLCAALLADEDSEFEYPTASDLNRAISIIAAGKAVDEIHAQILADLAVCRITRERFLQNLRGPIRFDFSDELRFAVQHYQYTPKNQLDREIKIDNRQLLEFSVRTTIKLMTTELELLAAADRRRAIFESARTMQFSTMTPAPVEEHLIPVPDRIGFVPPAGSISCIVTEARRKPRMPALG